MLRYPVNLTPDDNDTLLVTSPDFPDFATYGETREDALFHAIDAFEALIASRITHREAIPEASQGEAIVTLPSLTAAKVQLYQAMRAQKVAKAELSRRMECHVKQVDRLLDISHQSRWDQLDAAFNALGLELEVSAKPAA